MSKKIMNDDDWNAWVADVRTFAAQDVEVVLSATQQKMENAGEEFDADFFMEDWEAIQSNLKAGDRRAAKRDNYKTNILDAGRNMAGWMKTRGGGATTPLYQQTVLGETQLGYDEAYGAFWDVLEAHGIQHLEMSRSSKKDGGTDGQPYGNRANFVATRTGSKITGLKKDIKENLWLNADNAELFSKSSPLTRPYVPSGETTTSPVEVEEEAVEEGA
jgi:hypothetical protein